GIRDFHVTGVQTCAFRSQFAVTHWDEGDIWSGAVWFGTLGHNGRYHDQVSPPLPSVLFGVFAWPFGLNPRAAVWLSVLLGTASIDRKSVRVGKESRSGR